MRSRAGDDSPTPATTSAAAAGASRRGGRGRAVAATGARRGAAGAVKTSSAGEWEDEGEDGGVDASCARVVSAEELLRRRETSLVSEEVFQRYAFDQGAGDPDNDLGAGDASEGAGVEQPASTRGSHVADRVVDADTAVAETDGAGTAASSTSPADTAAPGLYNAEPDVVEAAAREPHAAAGASDSAQALPSAEAGPAVRDGAEDFAARIKSSHTASTSASSPVSPRELHGQEQGQGASFAQDQALAAHPLLRLSRAHVVQQVLPDGSEYIARCRVATASGVTSCWMVFEVGQRFWHLQSCAIRLYSWRLI